MNAIDANMRCRREMENEEKKAGERCFFSAHFSLRRPHSCVNLRFVHELNWILKNEPLHIFSTSAF